MSFIQKYSHFILLFIAFVFLWAMRFPYVSDPYFWDELGVYGSGVQYMLEHGISLQPKYLPPEISRGHPLLFYAIHAFIVKCFGNTTAVPHIFALILSSFLLLATYFLSKQILSKTLAAVAVLVLAVQNIFLAQSTLVVPEISIALLCTIAMLFFIKRHYAVSVLTLSIAVLIKESAILIPAFLAFFLIIVSFFKKDWKVFLKAFYFVLPLIVLIIFLLVQKQQNGWYFFPYHTDIVKQDALNGYFNKLYRHAYFIFVAQGRFVLLIGFMVGVFTAFKSKNYKAFLLMYVAIVSILVYAFAFYMDRYLLYIYSIAIAVSVYGISSLVKNKMAVAATFVVLIFSSIISYSNRNFNYDASLAYEDLLHLQKEAITWVCSQTKESATLSGEYFMVKAIENEHFGYGTASCINKLNKENFQQFYNIFFYERTDWGNATKVFKKNEAVIYIYR